MCAFKEIILMIQNNTIILSADADVFIARKIVVEWRARW